ncbi:GspE/PulE family protein [Patescibacteria group bacterium]|nr:GspE/PulE family protein [Patescibacteria group bacterium]
MQQAKKISGEINILQSVVDSIQKEVNNIVELKEKIESSLDQNTTDLLAIILIGIINIRASDIHIEPSETTAKFRIRADGVLQDVLEIDKKLYGSLVSRIKLLSKLKLNVTDRPQDGRFSILMGDEEIEIRTSVLPAEEGESVVMRILNPKNLISLKELGLRKDLAQMFEEEIKKPNGMIIVTGPTGSGKTTTLYAFLKQLNNSEIKIITLEDPIEYHLEGISQTQVDAKKGYDFASGLRSIMRQDPDVILVGEIRDLETASTAIQAALTGHLVFTTLHTNDSAGTIARLLALGEKAINISPAVNMAVAQRLVRRVCKDCVTYRKATSKELIEIKKNIEGISQDLISEQTGITNLDNIKIAEVHGCDSCNQTGYKGRISIFEVLKVDDEIEKFILTAPSIVAIRDLAIKKGMLLVRQDGFIKVLEKTTTIEEVDRVTAE